MIYPNTTNQTKELEYDIAIYGAGPAGITLARDLARAGLRIGIFEAGGFAPPPPNPDHPYQGRTIGRNYDLVNTRLRYLGGTTNHWGGWCRPLDPIDFSPRPHIPFSGWPISPIHLQPYYESAMDVCEIPSGRLGLSAFDYDFGYDCFLHHTHPAFEAKNFLFSPPTRFGVRYRQELQDRDNVHCYLNATLVRILVHRNGIDRTLITSLDGSSHHVFAHYHVLAMGAIENARTLLYSHIANSSGFVGRCFSDHLGQTMGVAILDSCNRYFRHHVRHNNSSFQVMPHLSFSAEYQLTHNLANFGILFDLQDRIRLNSTSLQIISQLDAITKNQHRGFRALVRMETTPNPNSRITLTNQTDNYGVPRVAIDWHPQRFDFESVERLSRLLGPWIGKAGGRLQIRSRLSDNVRPRGSYQAHHLGTTRMSNSPVNGVVNSDLRCHDISNLYIAGSSVFPTYGFANPTLTIVALSLRLANHLRTLAGTIQ